MLSDRIGAAERERIERDLHDGAQQRLTALAVRLSLAAERFGERGLPNHPNEMSSSCRSERRGERRDGLSRNRERLRSLRGLGELPRQAASAHGTVAPHFSNGNRPRVVVVDDQSTFRAAARMLLAARGYEVVAEAECAATALDAVERHAPDGVLLDARLGDDDGFEVCDQLTRSRPELAILLASADEHDPALVARSGARGFVPKSRIHEVDFRDFWPRQP
jgi:CheY-like chemotaxis protein